MRYRYIMHLYHDLLYSLDFCCQLIANENSRHLANVMQVLPPFNVKLAIISHLFNIKKKQICLIFACTHDIYNSC